MGSKPPATETEFPREKYFRTAVEEFGRVLDRIAAGYEADPEKRHDLRQEIHLQLWRSLGLYDGRCSLKTWTLRVAHNTAVSYVSREKRWTSRYVSIEDFEGRPDDAGQQTADADLDRSRALERLYGLIRELRPLDRQIMLSWLEDLDISSIAEITGLSAGNIAMKMHRLRNVLARRFQKEQQVCTNRNRPNPEI